MIEFFGYFGAVYGLIFPIALVAAAVYIGKPGFRAFWNMVSLRFFRQFVKRRGKAGSRLPGEVKPFIVCEHPERQVKECSFSWGREPHGLVSANCNACELLYSPNFSCKGAIMTMKQPKGKPLFTRENRVVGSTPLASTICHTGLGVNRPAFDLPDRCTIQGGRDIVGKTESTIILASRSCKNKTTLGVSRR